ncbi:unnamed protein product [Ilex paraguariensis]|uniref:Peptidase S8/S53 domain-containing protein n=1 Tax=Ilex paraguariensis TaxID=185542 RepID=A0ABC8TQ86_9AQUA
MSENGNTLGCFCDLVFPGASQAASSPINSKRHNAIKLDTTRSPGVLGLNLDFGLWPETNFGENVIIGLVDSGIWPDSDSFKDTGIGPIPSWWKDHWKGLVIIDPREMEWDMAHRLIQQQQDPSCKKEHFVACSAGNLRPHAYSVHNTAPWMTTAGAGSIDRTFPDTAIAANMIPQSVMGKIVVCNGSKLQAINDEHFIQEASGVGLLQLNHITEGEWLTAIALAAHGLLILLQPILHLTQGEVKFKTNSGTSISCPHVAALLHAAHRNWSPAAVRPAVMATSTPTDNKFHLIARDEDLEPATAVSIGAGHVNPQLTSDQGLIYDADISDYIRPNNPVQELKRTLINVGELLPEKLIFNKSFEKRSYKVRIESICLQ